MDFRAGRGAGQKSTYSWRRSIFVMMMLHASCGDPSSLRSHPISIPIPVISSLCLILCLSFRPSVCTSVCLQLQSIQIQNTGKFLFTFSHDDAPHPHHNHLRHLFQNCPSFNIPQLSRKYFLSHLAPIKRGPRLMFSKVLPIYLSFPHHLQPHSSYTCAV